MIKMLCISLLIHNFETAQTENNQGKVEDKEPNQAPKYSASEDQLLYELFREFIKLNKLADKLRHEAKQKNVDHLIRKLRKITGSTILDEDAGNTFENPKSGQLLGNMMALTGYDQSLQLFQEFIQTNIQIEQLYDQAKRRFIHQLLNNLQQVVNTQPTKFKEYGSMLTNVLEIVTSYIKRK